MNRDTPPTQLDLAMSRHALMAQAFELMARALGSFIDRRMIGYFADEPSWSEAAANRLGRPTEHGATDPLFQLLVLRRFWGPVFADFYGHDLRGIIGELIETRNLWAHFNLPKQTETLERSILAIERLTAPVQPETTSLLRGLRSRIGDTSIEDSTRSGTTDADTDAMVVDVVALAAQLSETESVFQELQDRYGRTLLELDSSRQIAADKQLRLSVLEQQLREIESRTLAAEAFLAEERIIRYRIEWLFVGLLATILLFLVLATA